MIKLALSATFITPAGAIRVPDWLEPYFACSAADKRALFDHMAKIELPATAWNEWRKDLDCERVSEIRTFYDLFTVWIRVALWQRSCRVALEPRDEWGAMIFRELKANQINFALTPTSRTIVSPQLASSAAI